MKPVGSIVEVVVVAAGSIEVGQAADSTAVEVVGSIVAEVAVGSIEVD